MKAMPALKRKEIPVHNNRRTSLEIRQELARTSQLRLQILHLYVLEPRRSLAAVDLLPDLTSVEELSISQVAHHVNVLRDAELLPERSGPPPRPPAAKGRPSL